MNEKLFSLDVNFFFEQFNSFELNKTFLISMLSVGLSEKSSLLDDVNSFKFLQDVIGVKFCASNRNVLKFG